MLQKWYRSRFSSSLNSYRALGGNTVLWKCWPVLWDGDHCAVSWDPFAPSYHSPTFCCLCFSSSTSTPHGSEPEGGRRPPPLGGQNSVNLCFVCLFPIYFFNASLKDQRFLPKNLTAGVFWCSLITFKLTFKQQNKNAVPSNTLSNSLAVLEWETWPFYKLLRCLLSQLNTLLSNF